MFTQKSLRLKRYCNWLLTYQKLCRPQSAVFYNSETRLKSYLTHVHLLIRKSGYRRVSNRKYKLVTYMQKYAMSVLRQSQSDQLILVQNYVHNKSMRLQASSTT